MEFRSFESLLWQPDAVNQMAFQLFDQEHQGRVSFGEIQREVGWVKGREGRREGRREREGGREKSVYFIKLIILLSVFLLARTISLNMWGIFLS